MSEENLKIADILFAYIKGTISRVRAGGVDQMGGGCGGASGIVSANSDFGILSGQGSRVSPF